MGVIGENSEEMNETDESRKGHLSRFRNRKKDCSNPCSPTESQICSNCSSYNWIDITQEFIDAAQELQLGELHHDEMFGLFEAMSAIEMMDPKMDAGMMCNRGSKKVLNFDQALKAGKLKVKDLSIEEQIGIIDATLACLVTWLEGHSLAQTVLTNLYLHNPQQVEDKVIWAFSIHALKMVDIVRDFVTRAAVFEEEDFQPVMYGYKTCGDVPQEKATALLKEVEDDSLKKLKMTRSKADKEQNLEIQKQHEEAVALYSRIKFCRILYQVFWLFKRKRCSAVEEVNRYLHQCCELLVAIEKTIHLGISPDPSVESSNRADYPTIMGFEPLVNQRLLPPTFPRYTKIKSRKESVEYLFQFVTRLQTIGNITECVNFHAALDFLNEFSKTSPCVLSRSILQLLYMNVKGEGCTVLGGTPLLDVLRDALRSFIRPPVLAPMHRSSGSGVGAARDQAEAFLSRCVRPLVSAVQVSGHNRARQRDKIAHLLDDMATLQEEADKADAVLHAASSRCGWPVPHLACFGTWTLYHTLRLMIHYLLSGFELELYSPHEYLYLYWYLYEFLYGWMSSTLSRANNYLTEQENRADAAVGGGRSKKNKKKRRSQPHRREIVLHQALQSLAGGFYKAMHGLWVSGKVCVACAPFDREQARYERRFAAFASVATPPAVPYAQFFEATPRGSSPGTPPPPLLFADAAKCFQHARAALDSLAAAADPPSHEVLNLLKVAKTNFVVMKLLASGHKKDSKEPPEFDFSMHKNFPIIKIV